MESTSPFPSALEHIAASALLLLSEISPSPPPPPLNLSLKYGNDDKFLLKEKSSSDEENLSLVSSGGSKLSASSFSSDDGSTSEILSHKLRTVADMVGCHEMKLKVVRRSRSKIIRKLSAINSPLPVKAIYAENASTQSGSCLSSSTSVTSTARSFGANRSDRRQAVTPREQARRKTGGVLVPTHFQRRADAILKLLSSGGSSSEVKIRKVLGDSPDTSKALRM